MNARRTSTRGELPERFSRYARQIQFAPFGLSGQEKLATSRALVCGCGALGSVLANTLVRAGVGFVRIVDRDFLEWNNLQRQVLYDEDDVRAGLPKAIAAANRLRAINSGITVDAVVADVNALNVVDLCREIDVVVDGTDNFETRFLINDVAHRLGIPWIYGGCVGAEGQTLTILPKETPCLRCILPDPPAAGTMPTCDTAGIMAPVVNVVASMQAMEALKILSGNRDAISPTWNVWDLWDNRWRQIRLEQLDTSHRCATCQTGELPWLEGQRGSQSAVLCGRNAVQVSGNGHEVDLERLAEQLRPHGDVDINPFLIRFATDAYQLTIFRDGRAIVGGTEDVGVAKSVYARWIGA